ncbi:MAG: iron-containing alcohol dehydrogenase [bacterium]|nr:iron-containing alcohol dehydrogenase [bacterium]
MIGYRMPTRVHIAPGCRARLGEVTAALGLERVVLVIDPGLRATPWPEEIGHFLLGGGVQRQIFDAVEPNPRTTTAVRIAELIAEYDLEGVVALGGGSVLDAAKAAAMLATNEGTPEDFEGPSLYPEPPLPMIAIPTTCGTGSEVTWVSVLSHEESRRKISVKGETMFPDQALVDADLIATLPRDLVAWTGVDTLTHAVEATTCTLANPVSDALAEKAIALLFEYLERAVADVANDAEAREAVMRASTVAGLAFGNADVAGVHCLSESLGGMYDVPHGLANAILLAPVMRHHQAFAERRLAELYGVVRPGDDTRRPASERAERFLERIEDLTRRLEIPPFSSFGIDPGDHPTIAEMAERNGSNGSNPRPMTTASYLEILAELS